MNTRSPVLGRRRANESRTWRRLLTADVKTVLETVELFYAAGVAGVDGASTITEGLRRVTTSCYQRSGKRLDPLAKRRYSKCNDGNEKVFRRVERAAVVFRALTGCAISWHPCVDFSDVLVPVNDLQECVRSKLCPSTQQTLSVMADTMLALMGGSHCGTTPLLIPPVPGLHMDAAECLSFGQGAAALSGHVSRVAALQGEDVDGVISSSPLVISLALSSSGLRQDATDMALTPLPLLSHISDGPSGPPCSCVHLALHRRLAASLSLSAECLLGNFVFVIADDSEDFPDCSARVSTTGADECFLGANPYIPAEDLDADPLEGDVEALSHAVAPAARDTRPGALALALRRVGFIVAEVDALHSGLALYPLTWVLQRRRQSPVCKPLAIIIRNITEALAATRRRWLRQLVEMSSIGPPLSLCSRGFIDAEGCVHVYTAYDGPERLIPTPASGPSAPVLVASQVALGFGLRRRNTIVQRLTTRSCLLSGAWERFLRPRPTLCADQYAALGEPVIESLAFAAASCTRRLLIASSSLQIAGRLERYLTGSSVCRLLLQSSAPPDVLIGAAAGAKALSAFYGVGVLVFTAVDVEAALVSQAIDADSRFFPSFNDRPVYWEHRWALHSQVVSSEMSLDGSSGTYCRSVPRVICDALDMQDALHFWESGVLGPGECAVALRSASSCLLSFPRLSLFISPILSALHVSVTGARCLIRGPHVPRDPVWLSPWVDQASCSLILCPSSPLILPCCIASAVLCQSPDAPVVGVTWAPAPHTQPSIDLTRVFWPLSNTRICVFCANQFNYLCSSPGDHRQLQAQTEATTGDSSWNQCASALNNIINSLPPCTSVEQRIISNMVHAVLQLVEMAGKIPS